jgi:hypothetical protein
MKLVIRCDFLLLLSNKFLAHFAEDFSIELLPFDSFSKFFIGVTISFPGIFIEDFIETLTKILFVLVSSVSPHFEELF